MSLAQLANFAAKNGFVDYGGAIKKYIKHDDQLADHALVFLFRPYRASVLQILST